MSKSDRVVPGTFFGGELEEGVFHGGKIEPGTFHRDAAASATLPVRERDVPTTIAPLRASPRGVAVSTPTAIPEPPVPDSDAGAGTTTPKRKEALSDPGGTFCC